MRLFALIICVVFAGQEASGERYAASDDHKQPEASPSIVDTSTEAPSAPAIITASEPTAPPDGTERQSAANSDSAASPPAVEASVTPLTTTPDHSLLRADSDNREADKATPIAIVEPAELMRLILTSPRQSRLTGESMRLADVVSDMAPRAEQTARIEAYWDLCLSAGNYYLSLQEQAELRRLRSATDALGKAWQQAESDSAVRIGTAQRAAAASQLRLAGLMGRGQAESLPLPADMPHCGDYRTRHDQIFSDRPSLEAAQLNELLPLRYEELEEEAGAVTRAEESLDMVAANRSGDADGSELLRAWELLRMRRRAFLQIACDYNRRIVRYTELAAPGEIEPNVLIGMLIKTDRPASAATHSPTTAPAERNQSRAVHGAARSRQAGAWTPVDRPASKRSRVVVPASADSGGGAARPERSLLVPPRRS